jgi:hypothetical protein
MFSKRVLAIATIAMLGALFAAPSISLAHERRTIADGKYDVVVGWDVEPAYANLKNGAGIRISKPGTNPAEPVTGAERTLKVDIRQGGQTRTFDLRAVFGQPGYYVADLLPTRDGDYQLTFIGTIGDDRINERFDTADGKFNKVEATTALQFPVAAPDPAQINTELQAARSTAQSAQTLAMIGVGVGALGLLAAIAAWVTRPRREAMAVRSRAATGERIP